MRLTNQERAENAEQLRRVAALHRELGTNAGGVPSAECRVPSLKPAPKRSAIANRQSPIATLKKQSCYSGHAPLPGEISLRDYVIAEAKATRLPLSSVRDKIRMGRYDDRLTLRHVNERVIFVTLKPQGAAA